MSKQYTGTDGHEYRGKAIKARLRLEKRIRGYEDTIKNGNADAYTKPGCMKRK
jgi:hypothetical protein